MHSGFQTLLVGGGMIAHDQILPSLYQLQREGIVGELAVCAQTGKTVKALAENAAILRAFPGHGFTPHPDYRTVGDLAKKHPSLYKALLADMPPRNLVVMALPDPLHYECIMCALEAEQHVLAVKPLVLNHKHAKEIETQAREKGLFVGVEYHKRFDDRALLARMYYRAGRFGDFRLGQAAMVEPYYYRESNFQNWCTCENTDLFAYVGCHYVDQVHFITGHLPVEVSVYGIVDTYPNGRKGYLWTDARVIWDNGGCLSVMNALGYPNAAAGGNAQGIRLLCQGAEDACLLVHDDQYRGVKYCFDRPGEGPNATRYSEPSPDYFRLVYRGGEGLTPVGYGYRSIEAIAKAAARVEAAGSLDARRAEIAEIDADGIIATPANSSFNELVIEAGRLSIAHAGRPAFIEYGDAPGVHL
ncbi:MAG: Gfo/Idh/MocA family oxidoreductase [Kiritimatiellaeota bacterium]|nr:Gfo/Idh/MocA family oxidoreductase [Kiritimatiellota bacterium]